MAFIINPNTPPLICDKKLHDHEYYGDIQVMVAGVFVDYNSQCRDDHHLPKGHETRSQPRIAVQIMMETTIEPPPVNERKKRDVFKKTGHTQIPGQVVRDAGYGNHIHKVK